MKRYIKTILCGAFITTAMLGVHASAEIIGSANTTNIGVVIDGAAIPTYNVDGCTFVVAEDLRGYGFDVVYDDNTRKLYITQNPYAKRTLLSKDQVNIYKTDITEGLWRTDMYATDITAYLEGNQIEAYAIDGQMVIPIRALEPCAYVEYDDSRRLVTVSGIKHYLDTLHNEGNTDIIYETENGVDHVYARIYDIGGSLITGSYENDINVSDTYVTYNSPMQIKASWGDDVVQFGSGRWFYRRCYSYQHYEIYDTDGSIIYEAYMDGKFYQGEAGFIPTCCYLRTNNYCQRANNTSTKRLYCYEIENEREYWDYWPSEAEINNPDLKWTKLCKHNDYSVANNVYAVAENGFLIYLSQNNNYNRKLIRYNISDNIDHYYNLSKDGVVYREELHSEDMHINSIYDTVFADNVIKMENNYVLQNNNELYHYSTYLIDANGKQPLVTNVSDFSRGKYLAVLDDQGDLYVGTDDDYYKNAQGLVSGNVKEVRSFYDKISYITNNNELYIYSNWRSIKVADNIASLASEDLYITTSGEVTDLSTVYATDAKDAIKSGDVLFIIKTDGTLWKIENGEKMKL